ncbi:MAG: hypothetical protein F6K56_02180 [Moorea sp. SIO3G5]|nr:hypothetical protein [Moorena sp. SIO3G5]
MLAGGLGGRNHTQNQQRPLVSSSLLPAPCSLLPAPCSLLPAPCSLLPLRQLFVP